MAGRLSWLQEILATTAESRSTAARIYKALTCEEHAQHYQSAIESCGVIIMFISSSKILNENNTKTSSGHVELSSLAILRRDESRSVSEVKMYFF